MIIINLIWIQLIIFKQVNITEKSKFFHILHYLFVTWNLLINGIAPASSAGIAVERVAGIL